MRAPPLPRTVLALSLVSLLTDVSSEMIYPLLPTFMAGVLGAGAMTIGLMEGGAETVAAMLKYASGAWSDRWRRRKPLVVAGYLLASVLRPFIGVADAVWAVVAIRLGDRVGKGIRSAPRDAMLADAVAPGERGRAFGFHRGADHFGAVLGPLAAWALLQLAGADARTVFLLAALPAALAMVVLVGWVRETGASGAPHPAVEPAVAPWRRAGQSTPLSRRFFAYLAVLLLFTLGNATDAFLLLRAHDLGVPLSALPLLWASLHLVKSLASLPAGALSDRVGRRAVIASGWGVYAAVYLGFALTAERWAVAALFVVYGLFHGLTEGVEKALVADLVPPEARGRAFGWFHLTVGLGALPSALLFGMLWEQVGPGAAFVTGAALAASAAVLLLATVPSARASRAGPVG